MNENEDAAAAEAASPGLGEATEPPRPEKRIGFWLGLALAAGILAFVDLDPERPRATAMLAAAVLMAVWWTTEALPLAITSLVPIALFPLLGLNAKGDDVAAGYADVAAAYTNTYVVLFLGGFLIALAMERWNLHRRLALHILIAIGDRPGRLILGFMVATGFLSMWLSNTACAMMMLPMAMSLTAAFDRVNAPKSGVALDPRSGNFAPALMLGVAYASSIGGFATKIGTPPNVVLFALYEKFHPDAPPVSFGQWSLFAFPLAVVFLAGAWWILCRVAFPLPAACSFGGGDYVRAELRKLGPVGPEERTVGVAFALVALLWIFRAPIAIEGFATIPGWSQLLPHGKAIDDGTIAIFVGCALFVLPARGGADRIMTWETAQRGVPWGILLLFGGGFALADGFRSSGLSEWIGERLSGLAGAPTAGVVVAVAGTVTLLTELTSNTATTNMILPVLNELAGALGVEPLVLLVPATLAASCAFMFPVATPPNAIVYGSGRVTMRQMIVAGAWLNLLGVALVSAFSIFLAIPILAG